MLGPGLSDAVRYANAGLSLALVVACGVAVVVSHHWDQRVRFSIFAGFGVLLTTGHLASLGREGSWRLLALALIVAAALVSSIAYVRRELKERKVSGDPGTRDLAVSGPRSAAGRARDLSRGEGPTIGDHPATVAPPGEGHPGRVRPHLRAREGADPSRGYGSGQTETTGADQ